MKSVAHLGRPPLLPADGADEDHVEEVDGFRGVGPDVAEHDGEVRAGGVHGGPQDAGGLCEGLLHIDAGRRHAGRSHGAWCNCSAFCTMVLVTAGIRSASLLCGAAPAVWNLSDCSRCRISFVSFLHFNALWSVALFVVSFIMLGFVVFIYVAPAFGPAPEGAAGQRLQKNTKNAEIRITTETVMYRMCLWCLWSSRILGLFGLLFFSGHAERGRRRCAARCKTSTILGAHHPQKADTTTFLAPGNVQDVFCVSRTPNAWKCREDAENSKKMQQN